MKTASRLLRPLTPKPRRLTPSIVRGLFTISNHADCLYDYHSEEDRDGTHELGEACDYLKEMIAWYRSKNKNFDVLQTTEGEDDMKEVCNDTEDKATIREIVLWALDLHHDELGDHLDLSDEELQNLLARVLNDEDAVAEDIGWDDALKDCSDLYEVRDMNDFREISQENLAAQKRARREETP